jgi:hypothetical protein
MLRDLEENEGDEPDKDLKEVLEPKVTVTESTTTKVKEKEVDAAKKK